MNDMKHVILACLMLAAPLCWGSVAKSKIKAAQAPGQMNLSELQVSEAGESPTKTITVESPGRYRLVVHEATGGGISEFYDLSSDPDAQRNVAWRTRGLFEIGWHGNPVTHDWPTQANWRQVLGATAKVEIIERSGVRVRIRIETFFTHWGKLIDKDMPLTVEYTFYPAGQMYMQVRVQRTAGEYKFGHEYGPHIAVSASRTDPLLNSGFIYSAPKIGQLQDSNRLSPLEDFVLITSPKVPTAMFVTIPEHQQVLFTGTFRHDGRSVDWDRAGYGWTPQVMAAGFDHTWSCVLQLGSQNVPGLPQMRNCEEALPFAMQYRVPPRITPSVLVTDSPGDVNMDGFNESEGTIVLKGSAKLNFELNRGPGASFCPIFQVLGWSAPIAEEKKKITGAKKTTGARKTVKSSSKKGSRATPSTISINGQDVPVLAAIVDGNLIVQVQAQVTEQVNKISFGEQ
jgi:hypothetical protein